MNQTFHTPPIMQYVPDTGRLSRRQRAAQLLEAVIEEQVEPRIAINRWPEPITEPDPSVDCAYQALWHFEADENQQKTELFYMDAQLELLRQMSRCLQQGEALPPYILALYPPKSRVRFFQSQSAWADGHSTLRRWWRETRAIWQQALQVCFRG
ncbi:hypothetical protein [Vampirovibrio sp.]|uniref:hypothetical protein n=1 Tax=Vampirovibrio sp. TaxID=2717857 RepID=UPI003592FB1A